MIPFKLFKPKYVQAKRTVACPKLKPNHAPLWFCKYGLIFKKNAIVPVDQMISG